MEGHELVGFCVVVQFACRLSCTSFILDHVFGCLLPSICPLSFMTWCEWKFWIGSYSIHWNY
ncbi:hypothetical protein DL95DRAFT_391551, partial [Leptodontidium sp. 2 PMI_412]